MVGVTASPEYADEPGCMSLGPVGMAINGVAQLSMRAIAKHTGMTAANLYNYFESKEALFIATKRRGFRLLDGFTTMPANTDEPPREQIKFILFYDVYFIEI